jgi:seryl-tRNA synthetase
VPDTNSPVTWILAGGGGTIIGSIIMSLIQSISGKRVSRADAADRVTNAAGNLADRMDRMNTALEKENLALRRSVIALSEVVEELIPLIPDQDQRVRAAKAVKAARLALR